MTLPGEMPFPELAARLRDGDNAAATLIFQQYGRRLIGLARSRLGRRLQGKASAESVVQSVFGTFFRRCREETIELRDRRSLWALLTRITLYKCGHRLEYWSAAARDPDREVQVQQPLDQSAVAWEAVAREPTPDEAATLEETMAQLLQGLSELERRILELHLQGQTTAGIAVTIGRTRRTVERSLERARLRLERLQGTA